MKIAVVVCVWPPQIGGIANSAYHLSQLLNSKNELSIFNPHTLKPWLKKGYGAFLPQLLWKLNKFDYIYLHYPFFGTAEIIWLFKIFHKNSPKLIIHYHMDVKNRGLINKILSFPSHLIQHALFQEAETIICASLDYIQDSQIKKYYLTHPEKFVEIPFSLDLEKFKPKELNQASSNKIIAYTKKIIHYVNKKIIKKNRLKLLFVGGLDQAHYFKGLENLLNSVAQLTINNWRLDIIGDGKKRPDYEKLAFDLKLNHRVKFKGKLNDQELIRNYQNADLLILPSINSNEAFGLVLIEALACGVPVIASDLPGVRSVFNNWQEGLLVKPNDVQDLKHKLDFILHHESQRQEMARAARRLALKKYDQNNIKKDLEKIFKNTENKEKKLRKKT